MKIGIDARTFINGSYGGIARSVYNILYFWKDLYPENEYYLISYRSLKIDMSDFPSNWNIIVKRSLINTGAIWSRLTLPGIIKKLDLDVYWGTNYTLPPKIKGVKMILTIYDLAILRFKNIGRIATEISIKLFGKSNCKKADKIIAISEATKADIIKFWNIDKDKIVVSYCGGISDDINCTDDKADELNELKNTHKVGRDYFLFIGTIEPRKNIITIVKAFEKFCDNTTKDFELVICGKRGWRCDDIYETIEKSKYSDRIKMFGYITDAEKKYLLKNTKGFVYTSLYEGFGIPILEAMEYEIPIITSNISSMPEVGGNAVFYLNNVYDYDELSRLMSKVSTLNSMDYEDLVDKMRKQRNKFSWKKNAEEMMKYIYE
ncbi:Glycosyltransferase involved in cell wall bisynthesis [Lachnospiraceae bacterium NE2001]|nr:Glycosyltransferase involved in cell wall bisynthesis [Lachnospiraceae bacterium NE2001]